MSRQEEERVDAVKQARLRVIQMIKIQLDNDSRVIQSLLTDAQEEIHYRELELGGKLNIQQGLPLIYWKGRESVCIELLSGVERRKEEVGKLLELLTLSAV